MEGEIKNKKDDINLAYQFAVGLVEKYQIENKELKAELDDLRKKYYQAIGMKIGRRK